MPCDILGTHFNYKYELYCFFILLSSITFLHGHKPYHILDLDILNYLYSASIEIIEVKVCIRQTEWEGVIIPFLRRTLVYFGGAEVDEGDLVYIGKGGRSII